MEAILVIVMIINSGMLSTERVSSIEECKEIANELREKTNRYISAYCIPAAPLIKEKSQ